ncbi:hypothetical protein [Salinicola acroporae]|uniref:hypothetical protein n=1 Tax=Salinicola acroporae TaxID=1541440 RepID=UPI0031BB88A3
MIIADYLFLRRGHYPRLDAAVLPTFHLPGLGAYALATLGAWLSPWAPPLVGIALAVALYPLCCRYLGQQSLKPAL